MPIRIECEECGARFRVDDRRAGSELPCKNCGAEIFVPEPRRRGRDSQERSSRRSRAANPWASEPGGASDFDNDYDDEPLDGNKTPIIIGAVLAGVLVVGGIVFAIVGFGGDGKDNKDPADEQIANNDNPQAKRPNPINPQPRPFNPQPRPINPRPNPIHPKPGPINPQPKPLNNPVVDPKPLNQPLNNPLNNPNRNPAGFNKPDEKPPELPPELAGKWDVKFDTLPEALQLEEGKKPKINLPSSARTEDVLWPNSPSLFVALGRNGNERDVSEVYDLREKKPVGRIFNVKSWGGKVALSPDGKFYAFSTNSTNGVAVWNVTETKPQGTLPLTSRWAVKALGFAGPKLIAAIPHSEEVLQLWSLPDGTPVRTIPLPKEVAEKSLAFSHGGKYAAIYNKKHEFPSVQLFDLTTGQLAGATSVPRLATDSTWAPDCHALMFSPDGEELAGIFEASGRGKQFIVFDLKEGHVNFQYKFEEENTFWWTDANSTPIQWFPNKKRWLIFGNLLLDREVENVVWKFSKDKNFAAGRRVFNDEMMLGVQSLKNKTPMLASFEVDEEKIAEVAKTVGAGGTLADTKLPPIKDVDLSNVRELALDVGSTQWIAKPDPAPAGESPLKTSVSVTATGGRMTGLLLSNPEAGKAVVFSELKNLGSRSPFPSHIPRPNIPRLPIGPRGQNNTAGPFAQIDVYNLRTGRRVKQFDYEFPTRLSALSPSGNRVASILQPDQDRLDIFSTADGTPVIGFRPYKEEEKNYRIITAAAFVDDDHLLTLNNQKKLVLWKIPECQAIYQIANAEQPGLSPNQQYLAVSTGTGYLLLDSRTGRQAGSFNISGTMHAAAFHPDGTRFAASCTGTRGPSIVVWSLQDGSVLTEFPIQRTANNMHWCDKNHLLMNNDTLVDAEHELIVWKYKMGTGAHSPQSPDGRHWYITPRGASGAELVAAKLPEPKVAEFLAMKTLKPEFLLQPGGRLSTQISLPDSGPGQKDLRQRALQNLVSKYQTYGTSVGGGADLMISMNLEQQDTGKTQELEITQSRSPFGTPFRGPFGQREEGEKVSISIQKIECNITFTYQGKPLNVRKASFSNVLSGYFSQRLPEGKSADEHLSERMWSQAAGFFAGFSPPVYIFRDFEGNGFGGSTFSDRGPLPQGVGG